ncbi:cellulase family glycosylhydrolase [Priestia megaterium]|uniref:cellulase family glycosylhydrolase n=1 Tax=Priestia megaterium TaxID=1404 RepID=UPI001C8EE081|nr:cellulase family glycosylhydrolase [Priestia megaterium]MBY0196835.1 cellulase family glycosylhydrolase [Priestia megaterium]
MVKIIINNLFIMVGVIISFLNLFLPISNEKKKLKVRSIKINNMTKIFGIIGLVVLTLGLALYLIVDKYREPVPQKNVNTLKLSDTIGTSIHELQGTTDFTSIKSYGITTVRDALVWNIIEREKGKYKFNNNGTINYDNFIEKFEVNKLRPYLMLLYTNNLYGENKALDNPEIKEAYSNWAAACAARYKNKNIIWEIYNEPNGGFWTPQNNSSINYTDAVKRTAPLIKRNDPSGMVVAPALAGAGEIPLMWLEETFKEGILEYIDAVSVHPYRHNNPETVIADYKKIRALISKYTDKDIPIISGEWGYSSLSNWNGKGNNAVVSSQVIQAQYLTRMFLINHSQNISLTIWYDWKNDGNDKINVENNFGLLKSDQLTPKQSVIALKTLSDTLSNYKFYKRINIGNNKDYIFKYVNEKSQVAYAFWTTDNDHYFVLKDEVKGRIINMLGEESEIKGKNITLPLTKSPSYIVNEH